MKIETLDQALRAYNKIEDKRDMLRTEYDAAESKLVAAKEQIAAYMMQEMKSKNFQSYEVPGQGVANIREKRRFGASDWHLVWSWIIENKCPEMLQKRLLDSAIQRYLEETGNLPPGVSTESKLVIVITKRG